MSAATYEDYLRGLASLATLDTAAEAKRQEVQDATKSALIEVDEAGRRARGEFELLDDRRNRLQRDVMALCREVGAPTDVQDPPHYASLREVSSAMDGVDLRIERVRKDWQWAQRYRQQRAAASPPPPPPPVRAPSPPPPLPEPEEPERAIDPRVWIAVGAIALIVLIVIALVVF